MPRKSSESRRSRSLKEGGRTSKRRSGRKAGSQSADDITALKEDEEQSGTQPKSNNEKLMVALRIRPLKNEEKARGYTVVADKVDDKMVLLREAAPKKQDVLRQKRKTERQYVFDKAFGPDSTQEELYNETTKHLVESVLEGYNATVFAYGATGGGKTYTMVGANDNPGIMVRALNHLFTAMEESQDAKFKVTMSYLEIYNENIRDLLDPSSGYLELRDESKGKNIQVAGLSEIATNSTDEVMKLLTRGNRERTQEPTAANKTSSRSHALLMVNVKQTRQSKSSNSHSSVKYGRLYCIDLAGSERAANTQNKGLRLKEGAHINRSLLALGNCINALAENKTKYVNYRDSKLTRLLKDALSGNCHTVMIAHISPADRHWDESRNTLVYADRAKNISNKVRRNVLDVSYHVSQYQNIIAELKGEIGRLKEKMNVETGTNGATATKQQMAELRELRDELVANFREQMGLRHRLMEIDNHILGLSMEFERQNIIVTEWETEKAKHKSDKIYEKRKKRTVKKSNPKIYLEPDTDQSNNEAPEDSEDVESGFEDNVPDASQTEDGEEEGRSRDEEDDEEEEQEEEQGEEYEEEEEEEDEDDGKLKPVRIIYDNSDTEHENDEVDEEEPPEEVKQAWEELMIIQKEQQRYTDIKEDLEEELAGVKEEGAFLENELPKRISTAEEKEILSLLCKVHELEIDKVEMKSQALVKEHEVRKRDLMILKFDKQRSLCDEIIQRQQKLIEVMDLNRPGHINNGDGATMPMPPELLELYNLYQQELNTRNNEKEANFLSELNTMLRSPSMLSLRGPEFDERQKGEGSSGRLPPIKQEQDQEMLFQSRSNMRDMEEYDRRAESRLSLTSADSNHHYSHLPSIDSDKEDSARSSGRNHNQQRRRSHIPTRSTHTTSSSKSTRTSKRDEPYHLPPIDMSI